VFLENVGTIAIKLSRTYVRKLVKMVEKCVTVQPESWQNYCLQPIQVVPSPNSPYYTMFEKVLPANLDYLIAKQTD
jgi:hypothetical protein